MSRGSGDNPIVRTLDRIRNAESLDREERLKERYSRTESMRGPRKGHPRVINGQFGIDGGFNDGRGRRYAEETRGAKLWHMDPVSRGSPGFYKPRVSPPLLPSPQFFTAITAGEIGRVPPPPRPSYPSACRRATTAEATFPCRRFFAAPIKHGSPAAGWKMENVSRAE